MVELVVNQLNHESVQKLEIHDHALFAISRPVDERAFDRGDNDAAMAVQLIAE